MIRYYGTTLFQSHCSFGLTTLPSSLLTPCHLLTPPQAQTQQSNLPFVFDLISPELDLHFIMNGDDVSPKQERYQTWMKKLEELKQFYHVEHGGYVTVPVPRNHPSLGHWVANQRRHYRLKKSGRASQLTDEREMALDSIGFIWEPSSLNIDDAPLDAPKNRRWIAKLDALKHFMAKHGPSAKVNRKDNPLLSHWIDAQRRYYNLKSRGHLTPLTYEREAALNAIGFIWDPPARNVGCNRAIKKTLKRNKNKSSSSEGT